MCRIGVHTVHTPFFLVSFVSQWMHKAIIVSPLKIKISTTADKLYPLLGRKQQIAVFPHQN